MKVKRISAFILSGIMLLSFSACGDKNEEISNSTTSFTQKETTKASDTVSTTTSNSETSNDNNIQDNPTDTPADEYDDELTEIQLANANAKTIYVTVNAFAQKCETAGRRISTVDNTSTGILVMNNKVETPRIQNVEIGDESGIKDVTFTELKKAVSNAMIEDAGGTVYLIKFNSLGQPVEVYWAENETTETVGIYPRPQDENYTKGGIKSFDK